MRTGRGAAGATGSLPLMMSLALVALAACGDGLTSSTSAGESSPTTERLVSESSLALSDASPSSTVSSTTTAPLEVPPTEVPATEPPATPPPTSPTDISQPVAALANTPEADQSCEAAVARDLGEPWRVWCYQDWASGGPTAYYDACIDCEGLTVLHLDNGRWVEVATCHAYQTSGCGLREVVPHDALCVIWFNDTMLGELWQTGCAPRAAELLEVQTASCTDYYEAHFEDDAWAGSLTCQKGGEVRAFQEVLVRLGYPIEADGYFGPASARSVASFQRAHGLVISAVLDSPTRTALAAA